MSAYQMTHEDEARRVSRTQKFPLGQIGYDVWGDRWIYVQETGNQSADYGEVCGAWQRAITRSHTIFNGEVGSQILNSDNRSLRQGTYGIIRGGTPADAIGQGFIVTEVLEQGAQYRIRLVHDKTRAYYDEDQGWVAAPGNSNTTTLFPSFLSTTRRDSSSYSIPLGVSQIEQEAQRYYHWIRQTGVGVIKLNLAGTAIPTSNLLVPSSVIGTVEGQSATNGDAIARALVQVAADVATGTTLILADIQIANSRRQFATGFSFPVPNPAEPGARIHFEEPLTGRTPVGYGKVLR